MSNTSANSDRDSFVRSERWSCCNLHNILPALAVCSCILYVLLALISLRFDPWNSSGSRPVIWFLVLYFLLFVVYASAAWVAVKSQPTRRSLATIWIAGLLFRVIMIPSVPILEIDIYRYLWDGAVTRSGNDPYRYSPKSVVEGHHVSDRAPELDRLIELRDSDPVHTEILNRIHYSDLTTLYPPVSQVIFACASISTPVGAPISLHVSVMKFWLTLFDIGTFALVIGIARRLKLNVHVALLYGWCPLVMKEIAGSGHLDSVAVFFTTAAIYGAIRMQQTARSHRGRGSSHSSIDRLGVWLGVMCVAFALAVGAKLYPVVLGPILLAVVAKRLGWWRGIAVGVIALLLALALIWPLIGESVNSRMRAEAKTEHDSSQETPSASQPDRFTKDDARQDGLHDPLPPQPDRDEYPPNDSTDESGLDRFLNTWEMNDLIFMVVFENIRADGRDSDEPSPWFVIMPQSARRAISFQLTKSLGADPGFRFARMLTLTTVVLVGLYRMRRVQLSDNAAEIVRSSFVLLAVFWATSPTQNPWYWIWCLPFLIAMTNRAWWLVSGVVGLYYLRFWLADHYGDRVVAGTPYRGDLFFYFVLVPFEHSIWMIAVLVGRLRVPKHNSSLASATNTNGLTVR